MPFKHGGHIFKDNLGVPLGGGSILPLTIDFSTLPDGALPSTLLGATWAIASGVAVNTPTLGVTELLTDPGLEANYTAGKCDTLSKSGTPTLAQSADVHGGSKAQEFTAVAGGNRVTWPAVAGIAHTWYQFSVWGKRTAGATFTVTMHLIQTGAMPGTPASHYRSASYAQEKVTILSPGTANITPWAAFEQAGAPFSTFVVDDGSRKAITSDVCAMLAATQANIIVKLKPPGTYAAFTDSTWFGLILRADSRTVPANYIMASIRRKEVSATLGVVNLIKRVGNTYSVLIADTNVTISSDAWLEVRASGSTVSLWYNDTQIGADQTVSDAELISNRFNGFYSTGGNSIAGFFAGAN